MTVHRPPPRLTSQVTTDVGRIQALRYQVFAYVGRFSATVEDAADGIARADTDSAVRRNALLWKMNAIPAGLTATVHPDPLAVLFDLWALSAQMDAYFSDGAGKDLFGMQQPAAVEASAQLTGMAAGIARDVMPTDVFAKASGTIAEWTMAHPLTSPLFARESAVQLVAPLMASEGGSIPEAIGSLEDRMDGLTARMAVYAALLPRLARWQGELMLLGAPDMLIDVEARVFQSVGIERTALIDAIDHQRVEAFDGIREQRIAMMQELEAASARTMRDALSVFQPMVDQQRVAAFRDLDTMRIQTLNDVREMLRSIDQERIATLDYIRGEREVTLQEAEQIAMHSVDRAFRELYALVAVLLLATCIGAAILIRVLKRHT